MSDETPKDEKAPGTAPEAPTPDSEEVTPEEEAKAKAEAAAKAKAAAEAKAKAAAERAAAKAAAEAAKPPWERIPVAPKWEEAADDPLAQAVVETFGEAILSTKTLSGCLTLEIERSALADVAVALRDQHGYGYLIDACGLDFPDREQRFEMVYHLHNFSDNRRIRLRVGTDEATPIPSVTPVWEVANWCEREAYDMYGIQFENHPDMTRILLWEGFNGYPLRKDFPVEGIDTGSAIYPEYYDSDAGPVAGTGTGWKAPKAPEPPAPPADEPEAN